MMTDRIDQEDPVSILEAEAVSHWLVFEAYVKAGFERAEAMQVVLEIIAREHEQ